MEVGFLNVSLEESDKPNAWPVTSQGASPPDAMSLDEIGRAVDERPWLCEELIQHVAAMPDPLPSWAKKIWLDFLHHVQAEQAARLQSIDSAVQGFSEALSSAGRDDGSKEVKGT